MKSDLRDSFNRSFTTERYQSLLGHLDAEFPNQLAFRISESPIFLPATFKAKLLAASETIIDQLLAIPSEEFSAAIPPNSKVAPTAGRPNLICIDFAICEHDGVMEPALIELQACASLNYYQLELDGAYRAAYDIPEDQTCFFSELDRESYLTRMREIILNGCDGQNVPLVDYKPEHQKTKIDFAATQKHLGTPVICIEDLYQNEEGLFFEQDGRATKVERVYNRFIFDEMQKADKLDLKIDLQKTLKAEWVVNPNWFFSISKQTMPKLEHDFVPTTYFVHQFPADEQVEDFVLKPLFSFSGQGVNLNPTVDDIQMQDPENFILQRKINFTPLFADPLGEYSKAEIRIIYSWHPEEDRPIPTINLARMTKSAMSNVDHNRAAKIWTGGSIAYFPE